MALEIAKTKTTKRAWKLCLTVPKPLRKTECKFIIYNMRKGPIISYWIIVVFARRQIILVVFLWGDLDNSVWLQPALHTPPFLLCPTTSQNRERVIILWIFMVKIASSLKCSSRGRYMMFLKDDLNYSPAKLN